MNKTFYFLVSGVTLALSTSALAELEFEQAGFSIGTVHDEHAEFFDKENDGFLDAFTYNRNSSTIFDGKTKGFTASSQEAFTGLAYLSSKYITVADINGDGLQDIISYPFRISLNDGNGHFSYPTKMHPWSHNGDHIRMQTTDLDNNGTVDLILSGSTRSNNYFQGDTQIFMNVSYDSSAPQNGYFSYETQTIYNQSFPPLTGHITNLKPNGVASGDVNNDGMTDIIFINSSSGTSTTSSSAITLNNGSGKLIFGQTLSDAEDIALGDLDNDGDLDAYLARGRNQSDEIWLNDGNGTFTNSGQALGTRNSSNTAMSDLDGDGDLDIVTTNINTYHNQSHTIWINDGTGHVSESSFKFGFGHKSVSLSLIDIDQDGDQDIITLGGSSFYSGQSSIIISSNEVWLNQLYSQNSADDYSTGHTDGISYCVNNPEEFDLLPLTYIDQIINESFDEGILACQSTPNIFGLHTPTELIEAEISGQQACIDNPSSCQLISQVDSDAYADDKYNEGYSQGEASGLAFGFSNGKQSCIDNPSSCELFNLDSLETSQAQAFLEGQADGLSSGKQLCIDDPDSCNLFDHTSIKLAKSEGLSTGFNNGQQSCIDDPESCDLFNSQMKDVELTTILKQIANDLPRSHLRALCWKKPNNLLCEFKQTKPRNHHYSWLSKVLHHFFK